MKVFFLIIWAVAGQPQEFTYSSSRKCEDARKAWLQWTQEVSRCLIRETA